MNYSIEIQPGKGKAPLLYYTRSFFGALGIGGFYKVLGARVIRIQREKYVWEI